MTVGKRERKRGGKRREIKKKGEEGGEKNESVAPSCYCVNGEGGNQKDRRGEKKKKR